MANVTWPLPFTVVAACRVVVGAAQVPPSMKVTLPSVTAVAPTFTAAVNVTDCPKVDGFRLEATAVVVPAAFTWCAVPADALRLKLPSPA